MSATVRCLTLAALLLPAALRSAAAQDSTRVMILSVPTGARPLGLGGAYITGNGPDALFYNVAQVGSNHGSALAVERIGGATLGQFANSGSTGRFGYGVGVRFLSRSDNPATADSATARGGALAAGLALATQLHGVWVGAATTFVSPDLTANGGGATFDIGAAAREFGLLLGLSAQNLGRDLTVGAGRQLLPTRISLGASLPTTSVSTYFDVTASAALAWERGGILVPKGGFELIYEPLSGWRVTGRAGLRRAVNRPGELRESAISLGGSFALNGLSIDYAFQPAVAGGQAVQSLGIRVQ